MPPGLPGGFFVLEDTVHTNSSLLATKQPLHRTVTNLRSIVTCVPATCKPSGLRGYVQYGAEIASKQAANCPPRNDVLVWFILFSGKPKR
jgi:hypothetical protein